MASCTITFENLDGTSFKESFSVHSTISEQEFKRLIQKVFMELAYVQPEVQKKVVTTPKKSSTTSDTNTSAEYAPSTKDVVTSTEPKAFTK